MSKRRNWIVACITMLLGICLIVVGYYLSTPSQVLVQKIPFISDTLNPVWEERVGGSEGEYVYGIWANESVIFTAGCTFSYGSWSQTYITKWDTNGNLQWIRQWGGFDDDRLYNIVIMGHYIYVCGTTNTYASVGDFDALLMKYDTDGNFVWYRTWGTTGEDRAYSITLNESELILVGKANNDILLSKYDLNGNQLWDERVDSTGIDDGRYVWVDGSDLYVHGTTTGYGAGGLDLFLFKWNSMTDVEWYRTWGGPLDEKTTVNSMWSDGTYLYCTGGTESFGEGNSDLVLIKWDKTGHQIWNVTQGGPEYDAGSSVFGDETGIYVAGRHTSGDEDLILYKCGENGIIDWSGTWGGIDRDLCQDFIKLGSTIYFCGWTTTGVTGTEPDAFVLRWECPLPPDRPIISTSSQHIKNESIVIHWGSVDNADTYTIFKNDIFVGTSTECSINVVFSTPGIYNITVMASNVYGDSELSEPITITVYVPLDRPVISTPSQSIKNESIVIHWENLDNADNYTIFMNNTFVGTSTESLFNVVFLTPGIYTIAVMASNAYEDSELSEPITITVYRPTIPGYPLFFLLVISVGICGIMLWRIKTLH